MTLAVGGAFGQGEKLDQVEDLPGVTGLAWDGENFWTADGFSDEVHKISINGTSIKSFKAPGNNQSVGGLAWDGSHLWMSNPQDSKIYKITTDGQIVESINGDDTPKGLAYDGNNIWAVDFDGKGQSDEIQKIDTKQMNIVDKFSISTITSFPRSLAWNGEHLIVGDVFNSKIYKISTTGNKISSFDSKFASGLAWDGFNLWGSELLTTTNKNTLVKMNVSSNSAGGSLIKSVSMNDAGHNGQSTLSINLGNSRGATVRNIPDTFSYNTSQDDGGLFVSTDQDNDNHNESLGWGWSTVTSHKPTVTFDVSSNAQLGENYTIIVTAKDGSNEGTTVTMSVSQSIIDQYDTNNNGKIDSDEVKKAIKCFLFGGNFCVGDQISSQQVKKIIQEFLFIPINLSS